MKAADDAGEVLDSDLVGIKNEAGTPVEPSLESRRPDARRRHSPKRNQASNLLTEECRVRDSVPKKIDPPSSFHLIDEACGTYFRVSPDGGAPGPSG